MRRASAREPAGRLAGRRGGAGARRRGLVAASLAFASAVAVASCGSSSRIDRAIGEGEPSGAGGGAGDAGADGPKDSGIAQPDAKPSPDGACGFQSIDVQREPANVYFVIDRSGSMSEVVNGKQKYDSVRSAVVNLSRSIGYRSRIGVALYPKATETAPCAPGWEVMPLTDGDPKSFLDQGKVGPVAGNVAGVINVKPLGGTPTAQTLAALTPKLAAAGKNTFVILATDGGPNCNAALKCTAADCMPNIESVKGCTPAVNCCNPKLDPSFNPELCLDRDGALSAVSSLASAGVKVVIVGIPGTDFYGPLLDTLAVAGGAPRPTAPRYYRVGDLDEIETIFTAIGKDVVVSCDFTLAQKPEDPSLVNLYFDDEIIPSDGADGWTYTGDTSLTVHGKACADLQAGAVGNVVLYVGCPTVGPK